MSELSGKVAIVTGASSGIGEAAARKLAARGAAVVVAARRKDRLDRLVDDIEQAGGTALAVACDVRDRKDVDALAGHAKNAFGSIDILFNNAGIMPLSTLDKGRVEDWENMIDINIRGVLYAMNAVLPVMLEQDRGHIVNTSSVAGRIVFAGGAVYCGTKHAVHAISEGLRTELAQMDPPRTGIRVTIIAPGVVRTELPDSITDDEWHQRTKDYFEGMDHALQAEDIADAVVYAVTAPERVNVNEILVRPVSQVR